MGKETLDKGIQTEVFFFFFFFFKQIVKGEGRFWFDLVALQGRAELYQLSI
jgi:hypothetical protein